MMLLPFLLALLLQDVLPVTPAIPTVQPLYTYTLQCPVTGATAPTFQWLELVGPSDSPFSAPTAQTTTVSFITEGSYLISCVVSDPGKESGHAYWPVVVTANFVPPPDPPSPLKVDIVQVPPPGARDTIKPVISRVLYGTTPLTDGQMVNLTSGTYAGFNVAASDNTAVVDAILVVAGTRVHEVGLDSAIPPSLNLWWLKSNIPAGTYPAVIRVFDGSGNMAEFHLTLKR